MILLLMGGQAFLDPDEEEVEELKVDVWARPAMLPIEAPPPPEPPAEDSK